MVTFFENIIGKIGGGLLKKEASVIGIDIGSAFLKVVQLKRRGGKAVLETYGELALGPYAGAVVGQATNLSGSKIAEAFKDLSKEANVTTLQSGISLPLGASLLSFMEMPMLDEKQLARMIPIEARKYIPVPISEVTLDWWVVPKEIKYTERGEQNPGAAVSTDASRDTTSVLVVAIHNEVINKYKEVVAGAGLQNDFFELEVFSTARATFGGHTGTTMILDFGAGSTKLAIIERGIIKSQHIVNRGSQDITRALAQSLGVSMEKAEEMKRKIGLVGEGDDKKVSDTMLLTLDDIFSEANRVLLNYQRKYNKTIGNVVLAGGGVLLKGLYDLAAKNLETDVVFADPFTKVEAPAFLEPVLKDAGPEFAVAIGLALRKLQEME